MTVHIGSYFQWNLEIDAWTMDQTTSDKTYKLLTVKLGHVNASEVTFLDLLKKGTLQTKHNFY